MSYYIRTDFCPVCGNDSLRISAMEDEDGEETEICRQECRFCGFSEYIDCPEDEIEGEI